MYRKKNDAINESTTDYKKNNLSKKPFSKLLALSLSMLMIFGGVLPVFADSLANLSTPESLLTSAFINNAKKTSVDASFDMKINANSTSTDKEVLKQLEIFNNLDILGNIKMNFESVDSFVLSEYLQYRYSGEELVSLTVYMDKDKMILNVPTFLEKSVYMGYNEMMKAALAKSDKDIKISIKDYYPLFTKEDIPNYNLISLEYGAFLMEKVKGSLSLGENKKITTTGKNAATYDCNKVVLKLTVEEYYKIYFELIDKLIEDPRIEKIVKTKFDAAIKISKENGLLNQLAISDEQIAKLDTEFSSYYAKFVEAMKTQLNDELLMESLKTEGDFEIVFYIDQDKNIRAISENILMPLPNTISEDSGNTTLSVELNMTYNDYDNVKSGMPNLENAYNLFKNTESTIEAISVEVMTNLGTYLENRPKINNLINGLSGQ